MNTLFSFFGAVAIKKVDSKNYVFTYETVSGIGEDGNGRRDPSDIFKIGDTYYVYYSWNNTGEHSGYFSTIYLAKSTDTINWTELGEVIGSGGVGDWDEQYVYTPDVMIINDIIYIYYHSYSVPYFEDAYGAAMPESVGISYVNVADIETLGAYTKYVNNPILEPEGGTAFDSLKISGIQPFLQGNEIYLYYKGRSTILTPAQTGHGVAICNASNPLGTYNKYIGNPIYNAGHEVIVWRNGNAIRTMIDAQGFDTSLYTSILESKNGLTAWIKVATPTNQPFAPSYFREDNFVNQYNSKNLTWGLETIYGAGSIPYLKKFTVS